ncbi:hypothetical protein VE04_02359 [Pseudogymnoascus sp. 24MN13]|nr:hypothetical protein VE04_02359 [Pseudogymnoascus sp. 24MN13]
MKLSSHLLAAWAAATATALAPVPKECGNGVLYPNTTMDLPAMVNCTRHTAYQCLDQYNLRNDEFLTANATDNGTISLKCEESFYDFKVADNGGFDGSLVVPGPVKLKSVSIQGQLNREVDPTNLTTIDFPDIVNITGQLNIQNADKLSSLKMPKLEIVLGSLHIDLSGGPGINLTFPSLYSVGPGLFIKGNVTGLEFPVLSRANFITVESTGKLDCTAFVANVVNATDPFVSSDSRKEAVMCKSDTGSASMSLPSDSDSGGGPSFRANILLLAIFVSCTSLFV